MMVESFQAAGQVTARAARRLAQGAAGAAGTWPSGSNWLGAAAVIAALDALPSLYWALGGTAFVWTVGDWAVDLWNRNPVLASAGLFLVAAVKVIAGAVPLLNARRKLPWPRFWDRLITGGAGLLMLYGAANTVVGGLALLGFFGPLEESNRRALMGHVFLWDPLFFLWGLFLLVGMVIRFRSERQPRS